MKVLFLLFLSIVLRGITKDQLANRRARLMNMLPKGSIAIIPGYKTRFSSQNILYIYSYRYRHSYPFQQNNNLLYLTGFNEPNSCLVLESLENDGLKSVMFVAENDEHSLLWSGAVTGPRNCVEHFGIDEAHNWTQLSDYLNQVKCENVFTDLDPNSCYLMHPILNSKSSKPLASFLHQMRVVKTGAEISIMREGGRKSAEAFIETMKCHAKNESIFAAKIEYESRIRGAGGLAYVPVVAGGDRANILHYVRNDRLISDGDLVLMDAGGMYHGFCSDVTRTWPVSGRFTLAQRDLYQAALKVFNACVKVCQMWKSHKLSIQSLNELSTYLMAEELRILGFKEVSKTIHQLYPHSVGHYLGMDVHDCPTVPTSKPFEQGMSFTIEPGVYVQPSPNIPQKYHGIGVRIEDDFVITDDGCESLTDLVPKQVEEIEALINA